MVPARTSVVTCSAPTAFGTRTAPVKVPADANDSARTWVLSGLGQLSAVQGGSHLDAEPPTESQADVAQQAVELCRHLAGGLIRGAQRSRGHSVPGGHPGRTHVVELQRSRAWVFQVSDQLAERSTPGPGLPPSGAPSA